jgi:hypothetical protein
VGPPRAAQSWERQNEVFKRKFFIFFAQQILNYWAKDKEIK